MTNRFILQASQSLCIGFICLFSSIHADCFEDFVDIYNRFGGGKYMICEEIIQRNHVLQAACIANAAGAPEEIVIGLLLHDVGQLINQEYLNHIEVLHEFHDDLGFDWLMERGFPEMVCNLVKYHTLAKVVLCSENPGYYDHLSVASKQSYHFQNKKYQNDPEALIAFQTLPYYKMILSARKCDDMAKIIGLEPDQGNLPDFPFYREMFKRVLAGKGLPASNIDWQEKLDEWHTEMCHNRRDFENHIIKESSIFLK